MVERVIDAIDELAADLLGKLYEFIKVHAIWIQLKDGLHNELGLHLVILFHVDQMSLIDAAFGLRIAKGCTVSPIDPLRDMLEDELDLLFADALIFVDIIAIEGYL